MSLLRLALVLATFTCVCHRSFSARPLEEERLIGWMGEVPTNVSCRQFAPVAAATTLLHLGSNLLGQVASPHPCVHAAMQLHRRSQLWHPSQGEVATRRSHGACRFPARSILPGSGCQGASASSTRQQLTFCHWHMLNAMQDSSAVLAAKGEPGTRCQACSVGDRIHCLFEPCSCSWLPCTPCSQAFVYHK